jgi:hypothetical protein
MIIGKTEAIVSMTLNGLAQSPPTVKALCGALGVDPREVWPEADGGGTGPGGPTGSGPDGTPAAVVKTAGGNLKFEISNRKAKKDARRIEENFLAVGLGLVNRKLKAGAVA